MIPRGPLLAVLVVIELAIIGGMIRAVRAGVPTEIFVQSDVQKVSNGADLAEGGAAQNFDVGEHPALTIDIGYADLTILTQKSSQISVSLSKSTAFGPFRTTTPIRARSDGQSVRISTVSDQGWSVGDDRMVTVMVPLNTQVTVLEAGDIKASGLRAMTSLTSVGNGSINVDDYNGPLLRVSSSDGRISLQGIVADRLYATSHDGRVDGSAFQVRDGTIESGDGNVAISFASTANTVVTAEASDGMVRLSGFPNAGPATVRKSGDDDDNDSSSQTVRIGDGNGRLHVHAADGNIDLVQEG